MDNSECPGKYFCYLEDIGILESSQSERLQSQCKQTHKKIVFALADFFKSLSPSDCYDVSERILNRWSLKQQQQIQQDKADQKLLEKQQPKQLQQQLQKNDKDQQNSNNVEPYIQQQQQNCKSKPPSCLQAQQLDKIDKNGKMNQQQQKIEEKRLSSDEQKMQQQIFKNEQYNNPFVKECLKKMVILIQKNRKIALRVALNGLIEFVLAKIDYNQIQSKGKEEQKQIQQQLNYEQEEELEDAIQIAPQQQQIFNQFDESNGKQFLQLMQMQKLSDEDRQPQQQQHQDNNNSPWGQQKQIFELQQSTSQRQGLTQTKNFQSEGIFSATLDQQGMCIGSVNENNANNNNVSSGSNKKSNKYNKQNQTFETAHNSIDEFQLESTEQNPNFLQEQLQKQNQIFNINSQIENNYQIRQLQQQQPLPFSQARKFNAKELIEQIKNELEKQSDNNPVVVDGLSSPNFFSGNSQQPITQQQQNNQRKSKCNTLLNNSTVEQTMQQPPNLKQSFHNIHERLIQEQISPNEAKTQLEVIKSQIQLTNCTFKPKTASPFGGTIMNQSRISNHSGSQDSNKKLQEEDLQLIHQLEQKPQQQNQCGQQDDCRSSLFPSNLNSDSKNQSELKDCTFRPLMHSNSGTASGGGGRGVRENNEINSLKGNNNHGSSPGKNVNQLKQQQQEKQSETVFQRLSRTNSKEKQQAFNLLKQHIEMKDCTFQPKVKDSSNNQNNNNKQFYQQLQINANSSFRSGSQECLNSASSNSSANRHIVFEKLHQEAQTRKQVLSQNQQLKDSIILKDCTFQPATLSSQRSNGTINNNNTRNYDVFNKLYQDNERKMLHTKELQMEKENHDIKQCTFQPKLVSHLSSSKLDGQQQSQRSCEKYNNQQLNQSSTCQLQSGIFTGNGGILTNNVNIINQENQNSINTTVNYSSGKRGSQSHVRLYEQAKELQQKKNQAIKQKDLDEINQFYKRKHGSSLHSNQDSSRDTSFEFLNRMKSFLRKKQDNIEDLTKQTMQECTFSPQTNKKAKQLKKSQSNAALQDSSLNASSNGFAESKKNDIFIPSRSESHRSNNEFYKQLLQKNAHGSSSSNLNGNQQKKNNQNFKSQPIQSNNTASGYHFDGRSLLSKLMSLTPQQNASQENNNNNKQNIQKTTNKNRLDCNELNDSQSGVDVNADQNKYYLKSEKQVIANQDQQDHQYYHSSDSNQLREGLSPCDDISELSIAETNQ